MPKQPAHRAIAWVAQQQWAIREESLQLILGIATRSHEIDLEAVMAKRGQPLTADGTTEVRDGVAIIPVSGPIFRYANLFTQISGATSIEQLALDLEAARVSPAVRSIVLAIDSPGGAVAGTSEFAQMIQAIDKPVYAYIDGVGASAAYWIASAADRVIVADTALVGSIGVVSTVTVNEDESVIEIVSTQSPAKRPDVRTEAGRAEIQKRTDEIASVFIETVARNRGVDAAKVLADFGQGGLLVGASAVRAGMADAVGTLESVLAELAGSASTPERKMSMTIATKKGPVTVANTAELRAALTAGHTADEITIAEPDLAALRAEGRRAELERIRAVESALLPGHEALIAQLKFDGQTTGEQAALKVLTAEREKRASTLGRLREDAGTARVTPAAAPDDAPAAGGQTPGVTPDMPLEDRCKAEWQHDAQLRAEFTTLEQYVAYARAKDRGQIRVLSGRAAR